MRVNRAQFEMEREQIERDYTMGIMSRTEYYAAMNDLDVAEREAFREAAEHNMRQAYHDTYEGS